MKRSLALLFVAVTLVAAACGSSSDSDGAAPKADASTTTAAKTGSTTTIDRSTTTHATSEPVGASKACVPYLAALELHTNLEKIATGSYPSQIAADAAWAKDLKAISEASGDANVQAALATLGKVSFQAGDGTEASAAPTEAEVAKAFDTLDAMFGATCASQTGECPAPETLKEEGYTCDSEGNLMPIEDTKPDGVLGPVEECPAPETLKAEGYTCDSEGYLTPVG